MSTFVNLEPGTRTYIANMKAQPDFSLAAQAGTRAERKSLAYDAMVQAEQQTAATLLPKLDALQGQGLVSSYEVIPGTSSVIVNVPEEHSSASWQALRGVSELGRIVRNREVTLDTVQHGAADVSAKGPEYNVAKVNAPDAWAQGVTGKGVVVGIVDTGVNTDHEALRRQYRGTRADGTQDHSYNFFDGVNGRTAAYDDHNHGTHVAGTVAGGDARQIGMAPDAQVIAAKVFSARGSGNTADILRGLSWMLAPRDSDGNNPDPTKAPDVVNNSWGNRNGRTLTYLDTWKAFDAAGIIPVTSAGNSGPRPGTVGAPGSYPQSISVGATDSDDQIARFSSRGPSPIKADDGSDRKPDISAPGVRVVSAGKDGGYVTMSGTSMSSPGAAGVTALLLSRHPDLTADEVRDVLSRSAVDLGTPGYDYDYGHGRIDAAAALALADQLYGAPAQQ